MQFVMQLIINQFVHVHRTTLVRHMCNVVYHWMNRIRFVQNVKVIWIVPMIKLVSMKDVRIHAHLVEFVLRMQFVMFKLIDHCVFVKKDLLEMHNLLAMKLAAVLIMTVQQHTLALTVIVSTFANKFNADEMQSADLISVIMHVAIAWMDIVEIH